MSQWDAMHMDPCRRCRGFFYRNEMLSASRVGVNPKPRARGYYCRKCAHHMDKSVQLFVEDT